MCGVGVDCARPLWCRPDSWTEHDETWIQSGLVRTVRSHQPKGKSASLIKTVAAFLNCAFQLRAEQAAGTVILHDNALYLAANRGGDGANDKASWLSTSVEGLKPNLRDRFRLVSLTSVRCVAGMSTLLDLELFSSSIREGLVPVGIYCFAIRAGFCQWCYS